jgi:hypothetical protein
MTLSRRKRLLSWLAAILVLLGLTYASLPWLLETLVKRSLTAQGLRDIQLKFEYPRWHRIRLESLAFTAIAGGQRIQFQLPAAEIEYQLSSLVTGKLDRIHIPTATLTIQSTTYHLVSPPEGASGQSAALPLAALVSGQWLAQLPLHVLSLDRFSVDWQTADNTKYVLQSNVHLQNAALQITGDIQLPPLSKPIAFTLHANPKGKADLILSPQGEAEKPALTVAVTSIDVGQDLLNVNGELQADLKSWLPMLQPWLQHLKQIAGFAGELHSQWQARIRDSNWQLMGEARLLGLVGQWHELAMPASAVTAQFAADPQQVTVHAIVSTANQALILQADGVQQFAGGNGHAQLKLMPVVFKKSGFVLSQLLKTWPYPFDIEAGRASAVVQLQWNKLIKSTAELHLEQIGGHYKKINFNGLNGEMALTMDNGIATSKTAQLHLALLDVGFPVENIDAQFALAPHRGEVLPIIKMQKLNAQLLGGKAYSGPFELDFARDRNAFVLQLEHIDLNEIMLLEQQEGLEGSGLLDGQLPISLSREGVAVDNGRLAVRAPGGVIRYTPAPGVASMAQTNPSVKLVIEALRNFQYQVMEVHSDYKTTGDLSLQVQLEGRNPDWQAGKPVHLNLTLQENIPVLLRSLQLSGEISERLRQHYQTAPQ